MKNSSTRKPRKLQRLAADGDLHPDFVQLLRAVGFDVKDVRYHSDAMLVQSDPAVLRWAASEKRILVCHDRHGQRAVKREFNVAIYETRAKVLQVGGDNSQPPTLALAKVLLHRQEWQAFFRNRKGGRAVVHRDKCLVRTAEDLYSSVQQRLPLRPTPARAVQQATARSSAPRKRRLRAPRASVPLPEDDLGGAA